MNPSAYTNPSAEFPGDQEVSLGSLAWLDSAQASQQTVPVFEDSTK